MRKVIACLLTLCLTLTGGTALAQSGTVAISMDAPLVVAIPTQMSGYFFTDMWGNNSVDASIRSLLHGYGTITWKFTGAYGVDNTVVSSLTSVDDAQGNRTYTFTLNTGLTYNDGSAITVADYVFSVLLQSQPAIRELGGSNLQYAYLLGYNKYAAGNTDVFSGVRLINDQQFSLTITAKTLPYFYELALTNVEPAPIDAIAPGFIVADDGAGAYLAKPDDTQGGKLAHAVLTSALLQTTLTSEQGYLHQPRKTCGPYQLADYDADNSTVDLKLNPRYLGNYEGRKPEAQQVKLIQMEDSAALEAFERDEVQMVHKISNADVVERARQMQVNDQLTISNYLNSGYAFLGFACEQEPTNDVSVRRAIAMCLDRNAFCTDLYQGNALPVYGLYGYGQWMVGLDTQVLSDFAISYDLAKARDLLIEAGYIYNEDGRPFEEGTDAIRCRVKNGAMTKLILNWAKTVSKSSDFAQKQLEQAFATLGIQLNVTEMSFADMLRQYLRIDGHRDYNLYFLSENFSYAFDPYANYMIGDDANNTANNTGLSDPKLMQAAMDMRSINSDDQSGYIDKWKLFQARWMELMPNAPIYCNVYFDVCKTTLYGYSSYAQYGLAQAILYTTATEPEPEDVLTPVTTIAGT